MVTPVEIGCYGQSTYLQVVNRSVVPEQHAYVMRRRFVIIDRVGRPRGPNERSCSQAAGDFTAIGPPKRLQPLVATAQNGEGHRVLAYTQVGKDSSWIGSRPRSQTCSLPLVTCQQGLQINTNNRDRNLCPGSQFMCAQRYEPWKLRVQRALCSQQVERCASRPKLTPEACGWVRAAFRGTLPADEVALLTTVIAARFLPNASTR